MITIDTSAVIAVLLDEALRPEVLAATRDQELVAPGTLPWEVANAFSAMFKRQRISQDQALRALDLFEQMPIRLIDVPLRQLIALASALDIYAYDACMIACATATRTPLLSLDDGLIRAAKRSGVDITEVKR